MKKIRKLICALSLTSVLAFSSSTTFASTAVPNADLSLGDQLEALEQSNLSMQKKKETFNQILDESSVEEKKDYLDEVEIAIKDVLENVEVVEGEVKEYDLGSGISIQFTSTEQSESSLVETIDSSNLVSINGYVPGPYTSETKAYGDRKYTAKMSVSSAGVTIGTLSLSNHYSIGNYGLKMRYVTNVGTSGTEPLMVISKESANITDQYAEKVGYNMNAVGKFSWKLGILGIYKTYTSQITSTIKLDRWDKVKKNARVVQSYTFVE